MLCCACRDLGYNCLGVEGLAELAPALFALTRLETLHLDGTHIDWIEAATIPGFMAWQGGSMAQCHRTITGLDLPESPSSVCDAIEGGALPRRRSTGLWAKAKAKVCGLLAIVQLPRLHCV